jgi:Flp pilus assembly protein TadG
VTAPTRMRRGSTDRGSAPVDFVLVGSLVTLLFLAVVQVGIDYHVRNVIAACAAEGARYGANADVASPQAAADRTNQLITQSLGSSFAHATAPSAQGDVDGAPVVTVAVSARLPLLAWFLPYGPTVHATGHALLEPR